MRKETEGNMGAIGEKGKPLTGKEAEAAGAKDNNRLTVEGFLGAYQVCSGLSGPYK